ncbi:MAG: ice-binding family protein [Sphaerochaetaceae bacterium]|jgi:hypothetical protein|nr:ice-binding family protein [Sphaerochaetaceae bacterium]
MRKRKNMRKYLILMIAIIAIAVSFIGCEAGIVTLGPPKIVTTTPNNVSTGANVNGTITATFDEAMDATTITTSTFTVSKGGVDLDGAVTYDEPNKKAIFAPSAILEYSTEYQATVTTGVKTNTNIEMVENKVWSFTTTAEGIGPDPVLLGTAGNYVMLAKTAISTIPASVITGDVGLSPAAKSYLTGFSQTDATGYATSPQVTGFLYAADMSPPTSSNLTTAVEDMLLAYNDAASRITPDILNHGAGEIGGQTLAPGLYKWTSSVTITGSDVTINGGANDTWIFQIDNNLSIDANLKVTLSGGAQAKNIVWQVAGEDVTMGTGSHFEGIVLSIKQITMNTGASINGKLLAQTQIALDQATVTDVAL